jgi:hypothetical protein
MDSGRDLGVVGCELLSLAVSSRSWATLYVFDRGRSKDILPLCACGGSRGISPMVVVRPGRGGTAGKPAADRSAAFDFIMLSK